MLPPANGPCDPAPPYRPQSIRLASGLCPPRPVCDARPTARPPPDLQPTVTAGSCNRPAGTFDHPSVRPPDRRPRPPRAPDRPTSNRPSDRPTVRPPDRPTFDLRPTVRPPDPAECRQLFPRPRPTRCRGPGARARLRVRQRFHGHDAQDGRGERRRAGSLCRGGAGNMAEPPGLARPSPGPRRPRLAPTGATRERQPVRRPRPEPPVPAQLRPTPPCAARRRPSRPRPRLRPAPPGPALPRPVRPCPPGSARPRPASTAGQDRRGGHRGRGDRQ